jgi:ABC-type lipoprotein release transport system permease subunit
MSMSLKLGTRNLLRNRWRSVLTLAAVAVSVGLLIWLLAMYEGWIDEMVRGATAVDTGQVQVHTAGWIESARVYESFPVDAALLARVAAVAGVGAVSPRVKAFGLIGNEQRSQVARVLGVDPRAEAAATPIVRAVVDGRWLSDAPARFAAPRELVLGEGLARQLRVAPGDELVVFVEAADGSLGNELLEVVGVVRTANLQVDRLSAYLHIADAQQLVALDGEAHELMLSAAELGAAADIAGRVAAAIGGVAGERGAAGAEPATLVARPWQEIVPSVNQMIAIFRTSYAVIYVMLYLVAAVGIVNTARMSALERRREFGLMMAIGMRPRRMFRTIVTETLVLGTIGALIGASLGLLLSWYHATAGFDMSMFTDEGGFSFMGVAFSERIRFVITPANVIGPIVAMLVVALLSGLWPAVRAARIEPAPSIAGRT